MHYDIILLSSLPLNLSLFNHVSFLLIKEAMINQDYSLIYNNRKITYDYLIIDQNYPILNLLTENNVIITNQYFQSSRDNTYIIGKINGSFKSLDEQLALIMDNINNPF